MEHEIALHLPLSVAAPLVLLCLALGAYMSAAETAVTGASPPRMHRLAQQGNLRAAMVNRLLERKDEAVSAVLLGNSVMNILSASLTTAVLTALFGAAGVVYATVIVGILVVIFAEVMPKTWALLRADRMALALAPSILFTLAVLGPPARAVAWISRLFLRAMGIQVDRMHDADEHTELLRGAIEMHGTDEVGTDAPAEKAMLRSVLDLGDRTVGDVMTHRASVALIDSEAPIETIVSQVLEAPYTRIPLFRGQPDNIVGVVGELQLDVLKTRVEAEYSVNIDLEPAPFETARWISAESKVDLEAFMSANRGGMSEDRDGSPVFLARNAWELGYIAEKSPKIKFSDIRERA